MSRPGASTEPEPEPTAPALAGRALALLAAEGLSLGLCLALLALGGKTGAFVTDNVLPPRSRALLLQFMLALAGAAGLAGLLCLRRRGASVTWDVARRLSPALLLGFVPPLLDWRIWIGRDLHFLAVAGLFALAARSLALAAASAPALGSLSSVGARVTATWRRAAASRAGPVLEPGFLAASAAVAYAAFFSYHTIAYHRNVFSHSFDLGTFNNLLWNLVHGGPLFKISPISGPSGSHLGYHANFFAFVLVPVYAAYQHAETLLAVQAAILGAAAIPLFLLGQRHMGAWPALIVSCCYLLYPPLHGANLYDFHFLALSPFFLWTTLYLLERRRDRLAAVALLLTLSLREDVAASVVVLGVYLAWWGGRPWAGTVVALVSGAYFIVMKFVVMLLFRPDPSFLFAYQGLLPAGDRTPGGVLVTILGNPSFTIGTLLEPAKLVYALQILVPLALLPLRRPIGLLFALPGVFFTLLSTGYGPLLQIYFQYTAHWTGFLFLSLILVLGHARRPSFPGDTMGSARLRAALFSLACATLICSHQYGAVLQGNTARAGFDRFRFGTSEADRERRKELYSLIERIPPRAKVVASETVVPHVSSRPDAYTLRLGTYDAEYLVFSLTYWVPGEPERVAEALRGGAFGVVAAGPEFALAQRGHEIGLNTSVLARVPELASPR